jgi:hypothetical protein
MRRPILRTALLLLALCTLTAGAAAAQASGPRFEISYSSSAHPGPVTGRLILVLAKSDRPEPRLAISPLGPAIFGVDVEALRPGQAALVDASTLGFPRRTMTELPTGDYFAQALLHLYTQVHRKDGHTLWVPVNDGRRETFNRAAGNLYSEVLRVRLGQGGTFKLELTRVIPETPRPPDTEWVKRVRIQSNLLTEFWGHPIYIHATVLLPRDYDKHPGVYYPTLYTMIHSVPFSFNTDPASADGRPEVHPETGLEPGYRFYQSWISDRFPRVIAVAFELQTPYFPDSYSVNSANNGPYGDALIQEVIPYLEQQFRMIRQPYARIVEGASTGGWQALALQLRHPDFFGGAWVLQPDPIDFRRYQLVNIYEDENAFFAPTGQFTTSEHPMRRSTEGHVHWTMRELSLFEAVLGSRGRSGFQFEGWEAVYGPVGADGYPRPLWDKLTGKINREVAHFMRDHGYDLRVYAERHWSTLGPKIIGKLHFFCGDMDNFYLNLAVYRFEEFLKNTTNPHYPGRFVYGRPMKSHSWHAWTWAGMVLEIAEHIRRRAPAGENVAAWNY